MKVKVISDLHLEMLSEFSVSELGRRVGRTPADVLVLAGDICPLKSKRWKPFLEECQKSFKLVLWVPGNHEYYGGDYKRDRIIHRRRVEEWNAEYMFRSDHPYPPLVFLNNQNYVYEGVNFIGSTLWTDFDGRRPDVMNHAARYMNDFHRTKMGGRMMTPNDHLGLHEVAKRYVFAEVRRGTARGETNFVITHHGPSWLSVADKFKREQWSILLNGAFVSALDEAVMTHDIKYWVHGHTHVSFNYMIENTNVIVNPHGYGEENVWEFNPDLIIEVK